MSDFLYSSLPVSPGSLSSYIGTIYGKYCPDIKEYHGPWGSLGISLNHYSGYQSLETDHHIFVVIGGPVLCFAPDRQLCASDPAAHTRTLYQRWTRDAVKWNDDLSGPFAILSVSKRQRTVSFVTDLMGFIPVYQHRTASHLLLGTHPDALARVAGLERQFDTISLIDIVFNNAVTHPFTAYKGIRVAHPAAVTTFCDMGSRRESQALHVYWRPEELNSFTSIAHAAQELRDGCSNYIRAVTTGMTVVAQFLSAGEDSRAIAGLLPQEMKRDAYVFLDSINREGRLAQRVAETYGTTLAIGLRTPDHYLRILPAASDLVGTGHEYHHAHSLLFHQQFGLDKYGAVLGGYLADTLLKGFEARKSRFSVRLPFAPEWHLKAGARLPLLVNPLLKESVCRQLVARKAEHFAFISSIRSTSAHEWFALWPMSMKRAMPNLYCNRRLFQSYEPFMCKEAVKRLFREAFHPALKPAWSIPHPDGRFPYFPWWVNVPIQFGVWSKRKMHECIVGRRQHQGPWCDWDQVLTSKEWHQAIKEYSEGFELIRYAMTVDSVFDLFSCRELTLRQKINLLQVLYRLKAVIK